MIYLSSDWHMTRETADGIVNMLSGFGSSDTVLVLGDLCNNWETEKGKPWFAERLDRLACRIAFIDGNHDDMNYLDRLPQGELGTAKGHWIGEKLFHIGRGETLMLEGKTFLALGGGYSGAGYISRHPDIWQAREMPSQRELDNGIESCMRSGFAFDYILSHAAPLSLIRRKGLGDEYNSLHAYLDGIDACVSRKRWYFGHYHRQESCGNGFELIYQEPIALKQEEDT